MLHDPEERRLFPTFTPEELALLAQYGETLELSPGEALFRQGEHPYHFWVVLEGEVQVTKAVEGGEDWLLTVHRAGEFAGEISILAGTLPIATARAVGPARALRIESARLRELVATCLPVAQVVLPAMTARTQEVDQHLRQQEKLAALGRMAAGLAHELNNPAAAVKRAAATLEETIARAQAAAIALHAHPMAAAQQTLLDRLHAEARACCESPIPLPPLKRSEREDELADWLDDRGIAGAWELAPPLVNGGVGPARLETVEEAMGAERLEPTVRWLAATIGTTVLLRELQQGAGRISLLVGSIKQYSHMDQSPELQETDLHKGLESTLALLTHKLKQGVEVVREYDPALPKVCAYAGELNQVWMNLVDNAVDAMRGEGRLWVRTRHDAERGVVRVEIADDGPGVPPEIQARVWEPFFTTKGVGEGSGLGLDIARRIIHRRHGGTLKLTSRPGATCFQVTLRVDGPPKQQPAHAAGWNETAEAAEPAAAAKGAA